MSASFLRRKMFCVKTNAEQKTAGFGKLRVPNIVQKRGEILTISSRSRCKNSIVICGTLLSLPSRFRESVAVFYCVYEHNLRTTLLLLCIKYCPAKRDVRSEKFI